MGLFLMNLKSAVESLQKLVIGYNEKTEELRKEGIEITAFDEIIITNAEEVFQNILPNAYDLVGENFERFPVEILFMIEERYEEVESVMFSRDITISFNDGEKLLIPYEDQRISRD